MTIDLDPVSWVRSRPEQFFFGQTEPKGIHLLAYVMADVLLIGRGDCIARCVEDWWVVGSDVDWLSNPRFDVVGLFSHVVVAPEQGDHSMRSEILLMAFASDVVVLAREREHQVIKGSFSQETMIRLKDNEMRAVAFRMSIGNDIER